MGDWLKLHRCLLNKPIWTNSTDEQKVILITLLLMTNWQEQSWDYYGKKMILQPGQFVTTIPKIQAACGSKQITPRKIRVALERFKKLGFLTDNLTGKATKSGRVITIENWGVYQGSEDKDDRQDDRQTADRRQTDDRHINKESKEGKDNIPYADILKSFNEVCKSLPKVEMLTETRKKVINARWKDLGCSMDNAKQFFLRVENSDFLAGRVKPKPGQKQFLGSFDWITKQSNFAKIIEGNYTEPNKPTSKIDDLKSKYFI